MSSPGFGLRCVFLTHGTNPTSTKQYVNGSTGLVAADSDKDINKVQQIFPAQMELASASASTASATFVAESERAPTAPMCTVRSPGLEDHRGPFRAKTGSASRATAAGEPTLLDGSPVAGFERIWAGRLSTSVTPAVASQRRSLARAGVRP